MRAAVAAARELRYLFSETRCVEVTVGPGWIFSLRRGRSVSEVFPNVRRNGLALLRGGPWIGAVIVNEFVIFVFSHGPKENQSRYLGS